MEEISVGFEPEQKTAGIRATVLMSELPAFFERAFRETAAVLADQGITPSGPPFGKYYGMPADTVDVEAGLPVPVEIAPHGEVVPGSLPGGQVAQVIHLGGFETMDATYAALERYMSDAGLEPGAVMWESYLSDPGKQPDPSTWRTRICWPVA